MDWKAQGVLLSAYAGLVLEAMTKSAQLVAAIRGGDAPKFSGLSQGEEEDTDQFLDRAARAIDARQMSPTFRKVVAKREVARILGDEVPPDVVATIESEIDDSVVEEAGIFQPTPGMNDGADR